MFQLFLLKLLFVVVVVLCALAIPVSKYGHANKARINLTQLCLCSLCLLSLSVSVSVSLSVCLSVSPPPLSLPSLPPPLPILPFFLPPTHSSSLPLTHSLLPPSTLHPSFVRVYLLFHFITFKLDLLCPFLSMCVCPFFLFYTLFPSRVFLLLYLP